MDVYINIMAMTLHVRMCIRVCVCVCVREWQMCLDNVVG